MRYKIGTKANQLMQVLCLTGEYPADKLDLFLCSVPNFKKTITEMKKDSLIDKVTLQPHNSKYRLHKKNRKLEEYLEDFGLTDEYEAIVYYRLTLTRAKALRLSKQSLIMAMAIANEIPITHKQPFAIGSYGYYTLKELRKKEEEEEHKTDNSARYTTALGVLNTHNCGYVVYATNDELIHWNTYSEVRLREFVLSLMSTNDEEKDKIELREIILVQSLDCVWSILDQEAQMNYERLKSKRPKLPTHVRIDGTYKHVHVMPMTPDGSRMIGWLNIPNMQQQFLDSVCLYGNIDKTNNTYGVDCDALMGRNFILFFIDGDIARLSAFYTAAKIDIAYFKYVVYTIPCWVDFLENHMPELEVRSLSFDDMKLALSSKNIESDDILNFAFEIVKKEADDIVLFENYDEIWSLFQEEKNKNKHFVPKNLKGKQMLRWLTIPNVQQQIIKIAFEGGIYKVIDKERNTLEVDCDAYAEKTFVLFSIDGSIARLKAFYDTARRDSNSEYIVYTVPFWEDFIKENMSDTLKIFTIPSDGIEIAIETFAKEEKESDQEN